MFKDRRLYSSRGDPVELISTSGEVAIVQSVSGERFSVRFEYLYKSCEEPHKSEEKESCRSPEKYSTKGQKNIPIPEKPTKKVIRKTNRNNGSLSLF